MSFGLTVESSSFKLGNEQTFAGRVSPQVIVTFIAINKVRRVQFSDSQTRRDSLQRVSPLKLSHPVRSVLDRQFIAMLLHEAVVTVRAKDQVLSLGDKARTAPCNVFSASVERLTR